MLAFYQSYTYSLSSKPDTGKPTYWRCSTQGFNKCKGRLTLHNSIIVKANLNHNHPPTKFVMDNGKFIRFFTRTPNKAKKVKSF